MMIIAIPLAIVICVAGAIFYGAAQWRRRTRELRTNLEDARLPIQPATYDPRETEDLPPPVRRYFRAVLTAGHPLIAAARFSHEGQFKITAVRISLEWAAGPGKGQGKPW